MLADLLATLLRRRKPRRTGSASRPPTARRAGSPSRPAKPASEVTLSDILDVVIDELGGPRVELDRDSWLPLVEQVNKLASTIPPPPAFPGIATQILALSRDPDVDVNELVGLVQRDAGIASTLIRIANSPAFSPAVPVDTLRGAIRSLGIRKVVELVVGSAGRSYYDVASAVELALFPALWPAMFNDAMANAFSAGRLALDIPNSRGESALFAGLLADVGRPIALRILSNQVRNDLRPPSDEVVLAALDEVSPAIGERAVAGMNLPAELEAACIASIDQPAPDAQIARLIAGIGAIQRRSPRMWDDAGDVRGRAEKLRIGPHALRALFAQRTQYALEAASLFGDGSAR